VNTGYGNTVMQVGIVTKPASTHQSWAVAVSSMSRCQLAANCNGRQLQAIKTIRRRFSHAVEFVGQSATYWFSLQFVADHHSRAQGCNYSVTDDRALTLAGLRLSRMAAKSGAGGFNSISAVAVRYHSFLPVNIHAFSAEKHDEQARRRKRKKIKTPLSRI